MPLRDILLNFKVKGQQKISSAVKKIRSDLKQLEKTQQGINKNLREFTAFGVGGKIGTVVRAAKSAAVAFKQVANEIDAVAKTSAKLGISTENLVGLQHAGEQTGVSIQTLNQGLQRMVRRISEAAKGTGEARGALAELGISAERLNTLSPEEQFFKIAEAMKGISGQADKVRIAMRLFDTEGVALVNTLALGEQSLKNMIKDADQLGISFSKEAAEKVEAMNDQFDNSVKAIKGIGKSIVVEIAPAVTKLLKEIQDIAQTTNAAVTGDKGKGATPAGRRGRVLGEFFRGGPVSRFPGIEKEIGLQDFFERIIRSTEDQRKAARADRIVAKRRARLSPEVRERMRQVTEGEPSDFERIFGKPREHEFTGGRRPTTNDAAFRKRQNEIARATAIRGALQRNFIDPLIRTRIRLPTGTEARAGLAGLGNIAGAALGFGGVPTERRFRTGGGGPEGSRTVIVSPPIESRLENIAKGIVDLVRLTERLVDNQPDLSTSNITGGR